VLAAAVDAGEGLLVEQQGEAVTPGDVLRVARQYLRTPTTVVLRPR